LKVNRRFGGTCLLHLQFRRIRQARNHRESCSASHLLQRWFFDWLILWPWRWRWHDPAKRLLNFNGLHVVTSQKIEIFITTAVRTSDLNFMRLKSVKMFSTERYWQVTVLSSFLSHRHSLCTDESESLTSSITGELPCYERAVTLAKRNTKMEILNTFFRGNNRIQSLVLFIEKDS
jgi:hypothetical protein